MTIPNDSIYPAAASEPRGSQSPFQAANYQAANYSPPPTRPPSKSGWGWVGFAFGGCAALAVIMIGGFLLMAALIGGLVQMSMSLGDMADPFDDPPKERFISGNRQAANKIAVLTIDGIITGAEDGFVAKQIRQVIKDKDVKAVVLRVDSPGGTMSGSDYYYHLLKKMKRERNGLPIVVSMGSTAASGGYYVSMAGDEIFAERSTITGSIGVIVSLFDATELAKKVGVESKPITSGPHKSMGSMLRPMTDEEEAIWQGLIDDNFERFKEVIREGRKEFADDPESLDQLATGQIYTAAEAEANQLIDRIGYLDDAIAAAMSRAGLNESNSKAIKYRPKSKFMDALLESRSPDNIFDAKTFQDLTTPRIYLLCPHVLPITERE